MRSCLNTQRAKGLGEFLELDGGPAWSVELPGHQPRRQAPGVRRCRTAGPRIHGHQRAEVVTDDSGRIVPFRNRPLRVTLRRPEIFIQLCNCFGGMRERIVEMPFDLQAEPPGHVGQQVRQFVSAGDRRRQLLCVLQCWSPRRAARSSRWQ